MIFFIYNISQNICQDTLFSLLFTIFYSNEFEHEYYNIKIINIYFFKYYIYMHRTLIIYFGF